MPPGDHGPRMLAINPNSGPDGDATPVIAAAHQLGVQVLELDPEQDIAKQFADALPDDLAVLGIAGGDGSLGLVAGICLERDIPFVCIPFGTRNHFARDLGLDRKDPVGAVAAFAADHVERVIDVGDLDGRTFLNNVTFGVYAEAIDDDDYRDAKIRTTWRVATATLRGEHEGDHFYLTDPGGNVHDTPFIALIANNGYDAASLRGLGQRARLDEGILQVSVIDVERRLDLAGIAATVVRDDAAEDDRVEQWTATSVEVTADGDEVAVGIDGEAVTVAAPVRMNLRPAALRVLLPASCAADGDAASA
jgi:diacylglycerol kinase family enzyme